MGKVIIDGVNVSGCIFYEPKAQVMTCHEESITKRCDRTNCYYKQLQRAKVENKELERKYADVLKLAKDNADSNEYCLQELEKENERLKNDLNEAYEHYNFKRIHNEVINAENLKYNQALQEIKEICNNSHTSASEDYYRTADKIQAKINEVIGAE